MDEILDDQIWDPGIWGTDKEPNQWGPPIAAVDDHAR